MASSSGASEAQLLLVTRDQVHAKIYRQPDENWDEGDRENVQMTDGPGDGKGQGVGQTHEQAEGGFDGPARFLVPVNEINEQITNETMLATMESFCDCSISSMLQHRFAGDADVQAGHLDAAVSRHQRPQTLHRFTILASVGAWAVTR